MRGASMINSINIISILSRYMRVYMRICVQYGVCMGLVFQLQARLTDWAVTQEVPVSSYVYGDERALSVIISDFIACMKHVSGKTLNAAEIAKANVLVEEYISRVKARKYTDLDLFNTIQSVCLRLNFMPNDDQLYVIEHAFPAFGWAFTKLQKEKR